MLCIPPFLTVISWEVGNLGWLFYGCCLRKDVGNHLDVNLEIIEGGKQEEHMSLLLLMFYCDFNCFHTTSCPRLLALGNGWTGILQCQPQSKSADIEAEIGEGKQAN